MTISLERDWGGAQQMTRQEHVESIAYTISDYRSGQSPPIDAAAEMALKPGGAQSC